MNDERLRRLLHETVEDVTPADRLEDILTTARAEDPGPNRRTYVVAVAAAATAAVVGLVAWAGGTFDRDPVVSPAGQPTAGPAPTVEDFTAAIYWLGDTPRGVRLYREFRGVTGATELEAAVAAALSGTPEDPDYRTPWRDTELVSAAVDGDVIRVELDAAPTAGDASDQTEAAQALEQVIRTAQAAVGSRLPVQFQVAGNPVAEVFGEPTSEPLTEGEWSDVLSLVSLSDPAEGTIVSDGTLQVRGVASSFEATVPWRILQDGTVVDEGFFTADGWIDRLHPYRGEIDVTELPSGGYVLEVSTSDPSAGEGPGPSTDTRGFTVR